MINHQAKRMLWIIKQSLIMLLITLVYTGSPKMQYWMTMKFGNKDEKRDARRKGRGKR